MTKPLDEDELRTLVQAYSAAVGQSPGIRQWPADHAAFHMLRARERVYRNALRMSAGIRLFLVAALWISILIAGYFPPPFILLLLLIHLYAELLWIVVAQRRYADAVELAAELAQVHEYG